MRSKDLLSLIINVNWELLDFQTIWERFVRCCHTIHFLYHNQSNARNGCVWWLHLLGSTERVYLQPSSVHSGVCSETSLWIWPASGAPVGRITDTFKRSRTRKREKGVKIWQKTTYNMLYLGRGDFNVDNDGSEGGFGELCGMVDGVCVQDHELQGFGELKYPLNLTLDLRCVNVSYWILWVCELIVSLDYRPQAFSCWL